MQEEDNIVWGFAAKKLKQDIAAFKKTHPPTSNLLKEIHFRMSSIFKGLEEHQQLVKNGIIPKNLEATNPVLEERLRNGGVSDYIVKGISTFDEIKELKEHHLICLGDYNIKNAISDKKIKIAQIAELTESQTNALIDEVRINKSSKILQTLISENKQAAMPPPPENQ